MDQIEKQYPHEISSLLDPPSPHHVQEYFDNLLRDRNCRGLKVKQNGDFGKGVYADVDFGQGELVLKDPILVGAQHSPNKLDCLVCDHCFQFIGTVEHQIGRKLYLQELAGGGGSSHHNHNGCDEDNHHQDGCDSSDDDDEEHNHHQQQHGGCGSSQSKQKIPLPEDVVQSLLNDELVLPHSKQFTLQSAISCPGGCHEAYYCSQSCAETDWENFHSLLCTGPKSRALCREALVKFIQHADETNDIFILAAKVISSTILKYKKMKFANVKETGKQNLNLSLLLEAWKPISMGYKRRWWDCMALPDEVDPSDEAAFRMQIKELAFTSLQLLKEAIFDIECEPLFSLEVYGHIIGMFELNNLDLVVASPVEDYFLYIDDLPYPEKERAMEITRPILDALGEDYSVCCQGTAFFSLQSCMNHSCCPNAKAFKREEDRDGQATIISTRPISQGEEVTISYIDEDLSYEERQAMLADYGFRCHCSKCLEEQP